MYTYKFVNIKHSMWTGKPKEPIEDIIEEFASNGWRLVQVCQDYGAMWYSGRIRSKIIFEKQVEEQFYTAGFREEPEDSFV
ncbi:MAG: DUF4177 domain-containing protein [Bacteroidota bacterium]